MNLEKIKQEAERVYKERNYEGNFQAGYFKPDFEAGATFGVNATVEDAVKIVAEAFAIYKRQGREAGEEGIIATYINQKLESLKINP